MEAPEGVTTALKNIRPSFRLVWNPSARVIGERSFDASGNAREVTHDPRWELWDTDDGGSHYRVMTLEDSHKGSFMPADQRFVDFIHLIDPGRYDGSVEKLVSALVDDQNKYIEKVAEDDYRRLTEAVSSYFTPAKGRGMVTV
jgi:hypothetical protein